MTEICSASFEYSLTLREVSEMTENLPLGSEIGKSKQ